MKFEINRTTCRISIFSPPRPRRSAKPHHFLAASPASTCRISVCSPPRHRRSAKQPFPRRVDLLNLHVDLLNDYPATAGLSLGSPSPCVALKYRTIRRAHLRLTRTSRHHGLGHEVGPAQQLPNNNVPHPYIRGTGFITKLAPPRTSLIITFLTHISGHGLGHEDGPAQELPDNNPPHPFM